MHLMEHHWKLEGNEISNLKNPIIHMHIAPRNQYGDLWGHGSLKTAFEVASDVKFELSDLNYIGFLCLSGL